MTDSPHEVTRRRHVPAGDGTVQVLDDNGAVIDEYQAPPAADSPVEAAPVDPAVDVVKLRGDVQKAKNVAELREATLAFLDALT